MIVPCSLLDLILFKGLYVLMNCMVLILLGSDVFEKAHSFLYLLHAKRGSSLTNANN
jgi:hypothetical protein